MKSIEHYFQSRFLRWSGHVARMPLSRLPRKFLTSWIADAIRPAGHPFTSWVTTLVDTLEAKNISTVFSEWTELAQDRAGWFDLLSAERLVVVACLCYEYIILPHMPQPH